MKKPKEPISKQTKADMAYGTALHVAVSVLQNKDVVKELLGRCDINSVNSVCYVVAFGINFVRQKGLHSTWSVFLVMHKLQNF